MKMFFRIFAAVIAAGLALVSCNKENIDTDIANENNEKTRVISVAFAGAAPIKSALDVDGLTPKFVAGDAIMVSNGSKTEECTVSIDGGAASIATSLSGSLTAVYPSSAWSDSEPYFTVSSNQDGTFASANICKTTIAEGATSATFQNQTAILKLFVPEKIDSKGVDYVAKSVSIKTAGDKNIADGSKEITVGDGTSSVIGSDGFCYVTILPGEIANKISVCSGAGVRNFKSDEALAINNIYSVALPVLNGYEYVEVDMAVDGVVKTYKWATCNVGATKPEELGWFFAWGGTTGYVYDNSKSNWVTAEGGVVLNGGFSFVNTPYQTQNTTSGSKTKYSKYLGSTTSSYKDPSATDADALKTVLDPEDDAAHVSLGGSWRMPTASELNGIKSTLYFDCAYTDNYRSTGKKGYIFTGKDKINSNSGKSIFFSGSGYGNGISWYGPDLSSSSYWSSSLNDGLIVQLVETNGSCLQLSSTNRQVTAERRSFGMLVRAISE